MNSPKNLRGSASICGLFLAFRLAVTGASAYQAGRWQAHAWVQSLLEPVAYSITQFLGQLTPLEPAIDPMPLIMGRRSILGSVIGGIAETQEVLNFCAEHGITCDVELISIQDIHNAYERMKLGKVRYRFVIDMASLRGG